MTEKTGADILSAMADTFRDRNATYGDNFKKMGPAMIALFPNGVKLETEEDFIRFHLLDWIVGKLTRFASTGCNHIDSIHDIAVYAAILESCLVNAKEKANGN